MKNSHLPRLDQHPELRDQLLPYCRLAPGEIWADPAGRHRVGCLDAANPTDVHRLMAGATATPAIRQRIAELGGGTFRP